MLKNKNDSNNIETANKDYNNNVINNKADEQGKYHIKIGGKNIQLRNIESSNNIKIYKDYLSANQLNTINSNKEHKILMPENPKKNKNDSNSNNNRNTLKNNELISRNKSFSKISNNKLVLEQHILSEGIGNNNLETKNEKNNKDISKEKINNFYKNKKKPKTTKFGIH